MLENGPTEPLRKAFVGLPPSIHALAEGVPWPSPNILSRKGHRKTQPMHSRVTAQTYLAAVSRVEDALGTSVIGAVATRAASPTGALGAGVVVLIRGLSLGPSSVIALSIKS